MGEEMFRKFYDQCKSLTLILQRHSQADKHSLVILVNDRHTAAVYECKVLCIERKEVKCTRMSLQTGLLVVN
jgi:hypothetical protein